MALDITITDVMLKETSALYGSLDKAIWEGETDWEKARDEGLRQLTNDLTLAGIDSDAIDEEDEESDKCYQKIIEK